MAGECGRVGHGLGHGLGGRGHGRSIESMPCTVSRPCSTATPRARWIGAPPRLLGGDGYRADAAGGAGGVAAPAAAVAVRPAHQRGLRPGQQWRRWLRAGAAGASCGSQGRRAASCRNTCRARRWPSAPAPNTYLPAGVSRSSPRHCRRATWWWTRCSASACRARRMPAVAVLIDAINVQAAPVFSLDVPSGLDADLGSAPGKVVHATATLQFIVRHAGLYSGDALEQVGLIGLDGLEVPEEVFDSAVPVRNPVESRRPVALAAAAAAQHPQGRIRPRVVHRRRSRPWRRDRIVRGSRLAQWCGLVERGHA